MSRIRNNAGWADDRSIAILTRMVGEGASYRQIADAIFQETGHYFTRNAVLGKAHRLGLANDAPRKDNHGRAPNLAIPRRPTTAPPAAARATPSAPARRRSLAAAAPPLADLDPDSIDEQTDEAALARDLLIPVNQRRSVLHLNDDTCRWPVGDPGTPGFFFCGAPPRVGCPYCTEHAKRAYDDRIRRTQSPEHIAKRRAAMLKRVGMGRHVGGTGA